MENEEIEEAHGVSCQVLEYYRKFSQDQKLSSYFRGDASKMGDENEKLNVHSDRIDYEILNSGSKDATNFLNAQQKSRPPLVGQDNELSDNLGFDDANDGVKVSSPTSSVTSNRKLEWDNGADIGYDNCQKHKILHKSLSLPILTTLEQMQLLRLSPEGNATENSPQITRVTRISSSGSDSEKCSTKLESSSSYENINKKVEIDSTSSSSRIISLDNRTVSENSGINSNAILSLVKKVGVPIAESTPIYVLSEKKNSSLEYTPHIQKLKIVSHGKHGSVDLSTSLTTDNKSTKSTLTNTMPNIAIKDSLNTKCSSDDASQSTEQQLKYFSRYKCLKRKQLCVTTPLSVECVGYKCVYDKDIQTSVCQRVSIGIQTVNASEESLNVNHNGNVEFEERQGIIFIKRSDTDSEPSTRSLGTNTNSGGIIASNCNSFEYLYGEQYNNLRSTNSNSHKNHSKISSDTYNSCNNENFVPTNLKRSQVKSDLTALHCESDETSSKSSPLGNLIASRRSNNLIPDVDKSIDLLQKLLKSKKYDKVTKQYYLDKIVKKILNSTYNSDTSVNSNREEINLSDYTIQRMDRDQNNCPSFAEDVNSSQNRDISLQDNLPWIPPTLPNIKPLANNWTNRKLEVRTFSTEIMPSTSHQASQHLVNAKLKDPRFTLARDNIYLGHDFKSTPYASQCDLNQLNFENFPEKFVLPQSSNQSTLESSEVENKYVNKTHKFQDWKSDKTLSEKLFEQRRFQNCSDKCHGDGNLSSTTDTDIVVNFAKKERENQLHWVSSEISHLSKLKDLLQKRSIEKQHKHVDVLTEPQNEMRESKKSTSVYVITTEASNSAKNHNDLHADMTRQGSKYNSQNSPNSNSHESGAYKKYQPRDAVLCADDTCPYIKSIAKNKLKMAVNDTVVIDDNISTELQDAKLISKQIYNQGPYSCIRRYVFEVPIDYSKAVRKSNYLTKYDSDDRDKLEYVGKINPQTHLYDRNEKITYISAGDVQTDTTTQKVNPSQVIDANGTRVINDVGKQDEINNSVHSYKRQNETITDSQANKLDDSTGQTINKKPNSNTRRFQKYTKDINGSMSNEPSKPHVQKSTETDKSRDRNMKMQRTPRGTSGTYKDDIQMYNDKLDGSIKTYMQKGSETEKSNDASPNNIHGVAIGDLKNYIENTKMYDDERSELLKSYEHKTSETEKSNEYKIKGSRNGLSERSSHNQKQSDIERKGAVNHSLTGIGYDDKSKFQKARPKADKLFRTINNDKSEIQRGKRKDISTPESSIEKLEVRTKTRQSVINATSDTDDENSDTGGEQKEDQHKRQIAKTKHKSTDPIHSKESTNDTDDENITTEGEEKEDQHKRQIAKMKYKSMDPKHSKENTNDTDDENINTEGEKKEDQHKRQIAKMKHKPTEVKRSRKSTNDTNDENVDMEGEKKEDQRKRQIAIKKHKSTDPKRSKNSTNDDENIDTEDETKEDQHKSQIAKNKHKPTELKRSKKSINETNDENINTDIDEEDQHKSQIANKKHKPTDIKRSKKITSDTDDENIDADCEKKVDHHKSQIAKKKHKPTDLKRSKKSISESDDESTELAGEHNGDQPVDKRQIEKNKYVKVKDQKRLKKGTNDENAYVESEKKADWHVANSETVKKRQKRTSEDTSAMDDEQHADKSSEKKLAKAYQKKESKAKTGESITSSMSNSSATSDSSESYTIDICPCCKLNEASIRTKALATTLQNNIQRSLCQPCYVQSQRTNWQHQQPYYAYPGHVCNCLTLMKSETVNEIKRTVDELDKLEKQTNYCTCRYSKSKHCSHRNCKRRQKPKKSIAYTLTFEDGDPESDEEVKRNPLLEEITIKIPNRYHREKRNKDNENAKHRNKHDKENTPHSKKHKHSQNNEKKSKHITLQDYLYLNRRSFIESAEERRKCMIDLAYLREKRCQKYKQLLALTNGVTVNNENNEQKKARMFSSQEMKKITAKNYKKLPEVQKKLYDNKEKQIKTANRLLADIFNKKLQENALKGNLTLSTNASVIRLN